MKFLMGILVAVAALGAQARAEAPYPNRPVQIVVPYPAGGLTDILTRALAERLAKIVKASGAKLQ